MEAEVTEEENVEAAVEVEMESATVNNGMKTVGKRLDTNPKTLQVKMEHWKKTNNRMMKKDNSFVGSEAMGEEEEERAEVEEEKVEVAEVSEVVEIASKTTETLATDNKTRKISNERVKADK